MSYVIVVTGLDITVLCCSRSCRNVNPCARTAFLGLALVPHLLDGCDGEFRLFHGGIDVVGPLPSTSGEETFCGHSA